MCLIILLLFFIFYLTAQSKICIKEMPVELQQQTPGCYRIMSKRACPSHWSLVSWCSTHSPTWYGKKNSQILKYLKERKKKKKEETIKASLFHPSGPLVPNNPHYLQPKTLCYQGNSCIDGVASWKHVWQKRYLKHHTYNCNQGRPVAEMTGAELFLSLSVWFKFHTCTTGDKN